MDTEPTRKVCSTFARNSQVSSHVESIAPFFSPTSCGFRISVHFSQFTERRTTSRKMRIGGRSRVRLVSTTEIRARERERERRLTRSSYRLLGALESPSNDPLFRALCYQPFREEHRGLWPLVLLFHGANERSAVSRFDRDKRDRALTPRCRTIAFRSMFLRDVDTSYAEYAYMARDVVRKGAYPRSMRCPALIGSLLSISADEPFPSIVFFSSSDRRTPHRGWSHAIEIEYSTVVRRWIAWIG